MSLKAAALRAWTPAGARDVREEVVVEKTKGTMVPGSMCWPATRGKRAGVRCETRRLCANRARRMTSRRPRVCAGRMGVCVLGSGVACYTRIRLAHPISRLEPATHRLCSPNFVPAEDDHQDEVLARIFSCALARRGKPAILDGSWSTSLRGRTLHRRDGAGRAAW